MSFDIRHKTKHCKKECEKGMRDIGVDEEELTEGELTWVVNQMKDKRALGHNGI